MYNSAMRSVFAAVFVILAFVGSASAQSMRDLVDLSRIARSRDRQPVGRVYTSEDLRRFVPVLDPESAPEITVPSDSVEEAAAEEAPDASLSETPSEPVLISEQDWIDWQDAITAQQALVEDLERQEAIQQASIGEIPLSIANLDQIGAAQATLESIRGALETARQLLQEIQATPPDAAVN